MSIKKMKKEIVDIAKILFVLSLCLLYIPFNIIVGVGALLKTLLKKIF